jgi:hypothetical protein
MMHAHNAIHSLASLATAAVAIGLVTGCSTGAPRSLAHAEQIASTCPTDGVQIAALVQVDRSGSRRLAVTAPTEEQVIREAAERTLICGGHLRVTVFSGSMIGVTVFDADLRLEGATANSQLRKAPKAVDGVMEQVTAALPEAIDRLGDGATDIVGQYQQGAEYAAQLSATGPVLLEQTIVTDGIQTAGVDLEDQSLTEQQAVEMAATVGVPNLPGATVRLIGIGRQADDAPLPTPYIAALRAFHTAICERTQATCTVVTDAAGT